MSLLAVLAAALLLAKEEGRRRHSAAGRWLSGTLALLVAACGSSTQTARLTTTPLPVTMTPVWRDLPQATDIQFAQGGGETTALVLLQDGKAVWLSPDGTQRGTAFTVDVISGGELGLLGVAFHPKFAENGRFFLDYTVPGGTAARTRIAEWHAPDANLREGKAVFVKTILEIDQPYRNHNGGQLQFGPDGKLYIGVGDGGAEGDPQKRGQNPGTLLGKILRIDIDGVEGGQAYQIPDDNPFVGHTGVRPEIWALGLRNPWRFSFAPDGRMVIADVGQDEWEELDFGVAGANYGWSIREGAHCYNPPASCRTDGLRDPFFEYSHADGDSITGGYVYTGKRVPVLKDKYVFGDLTGKIWALDLPPTDGKVTALSRLPVLTALTPSTFGRDPDGEIYVADYASGVVYRLDTP